MESIRPRTPSPNRNHPDLDGLQADTLRKTRFFDAIDANTGPDKKPLKDVYLDQNVSERTARFWRKQRRLEGTPKACRTANRAGIGRHTKVSDAVLDTLLDPQQPVRNQHYDAQIRWFHLEVHLRTLQRNLTKRRREAKLFKRRKVKEISQKNKDARVEYGQEHKTHTVENFWKYVHFTDEAHVDPGAMARERILREEGTATDPENLQEMPDFQGAKLHISAEVSWYKIGDLQFYNDENDPPEVQVKASKKRKPTKPRKNESEEAFQQRMREWYAEQPHDIEIKPKGNSMTQAYYTKKLLPVYIRSVQEERVQYGRAILQEDNDPSHGIRLNKVMAKKGLKNVAQQLKDNEWIETMTHPAQSPDLNVAEACWNILFQRLRREVWHTIAQLKIVLQRVWRGISLEQVRSRIKEMPARCQQLVKTGGKAIKSDKW